MKITFSDILAQSQVPGSQPGVEMTNQLVWFGAILVVMWLLMIRPQQKKQKELMARIAALKTGDRVVTSGGIHGTVTNVKDGATLTLRVDDSCKLTVDKAAISIVLPKDAA